MTILRNFDTPLDEAGTTRMKTASVVTEEVRITHEPSQARTFVDKPIEEWGWEQVRDYVVHEIETRHGMFPRDSKKEYGIFNAFVGRWGAQAGPIARHAFEVAGGYWSGAPISVNRFCKNSDPFFAEIIAARIDQPQQTAWQ